MITLSYSVTVPRKYKGKKFADDITNHLIEYVHRYVREELKNRENYHFQMGNISPWGKQELPVQEGWSFRKYGTTLLATNNLMKAGELYNGTKPYCSRYIKAGGPKHWVGPKKMHFWYQGKEMFRYCVQGIPSNSRVNFSFRQDIDNAAEFGIQKGQKAFSRYMKREYG
jgi:hypothetical protein